jgi:transposase
MSTDADSLPDDLDQLRAVLLAERAQHEATVIQHEATLAQIEATVSSQQRTIQQQEQTIARLLRKMYGPQQERIDPNQLTLFDADELEELAEELAAKRSPAASSLARKRGHGRRPLPRNLPREQVVHELPEAQRQCPCCGEVRQEIGRETSEQLEYIPGTMKVIEHVRLKYACRGCQEQVAIAVKPPQPIDKGLPGPGLLAWIVLSKYGDHLPLYRQEDIVSRWGVVLRRSTLCGWIAAAADLVQPLVKRMQQLLLASHVIHTDDTSVKLLDPLIGHARTARFWAYIGDSAHPYSIYDFTDSRQRDGPAKFLKDFSGYLQADAYGGYDGIYSGGKVREVACWAHARRYWWEARTTDPRRAHHALGLIARLYQLEATFAGLSPEARCAARQEHAAPILTEFGRWLEEQRSGPVPKSPVGQAVTYTLNQWQALVRYTEDGALAIDNNVSERTVKIPAIGRKNWLFVASREGGRRAAALFSLVASCKANQVEPWAYLRDVFTRLPQLGESLPSAALDSLLPDRWLADHPQHRWQIDHLRRQERDKKAVRHR